MAIDLSGFEVTRAHSAGNRPGFSPQARINHAFAVALIVFLFLVPIPLGSNRPVFWSVNAFAVGLLGTGYALSMLWHGDRFRFPLKSMPFISLVWLGLCLFAAFQFLVPLESVFQGRGGIETLAATPSLAAGASLHTFLQFIAYGVFFFLVLQVASNRTRAMFIARAIFWIAVAHAIHGLLALTQLGDPLLFFEKQAYFGVATGTFVNRNSFATFLAFGLVVGLALTMGHFIKRDRSERNHMQIWFYLVGIGFLGAALFATQSRMGLFAGLAGSVFVLALASWKGRNSPKRVVLATLLTAAGVAALLVIGFGSATLERLGGAEQSLDVRAELYRQVLAMIAQRPLLGYGGGSFEVVYPLFHDHPVSPDLVWDKAHSTYLALWSELGVLFGSIPLLVVAVISFRCLKLTLARSTDWVLPLAALGATVTAALHSLVDFSLEMQANAFFFIAILALGLAGVSSFARPGSAK